MLGRIQPEYFPAVFGASGSEPLDAGIVREKFTSLARQIGERRARPVPGGPQPGSRAGSGHPEQVAAGFLEIAVANMANAIKKISVQRGYDITRYVLATFGGAGGQHACAVADALGITEVLIHPLAGVLSAYGMGLADVTAMRERSVEAPLSAGLLPELDRVADALAADALAATGATAGAGPAGVRQVRRAHLRYEGTDTALPVPLGPLPQMLADFEQAYRQFFSFLMPDKAIIAEAVSVELAAPSAPLAAPVLADAPRGRAAGAAAAARAGGRERSIRFAVYGRWVDTGAAGPATGPAPRRAGGRPGADRGGLRDHRGRAGLAGGADRAG